MFREFNIVEESLFFPEGRWYISEKLLMRHMNLHYKEGKILL